MQQTTLLLSKLDQGAEDSLSSLSSTIEYIHHQFNFKKHPYFLWMRETDRESFRDSQAGFRFAVEEFSCAIATVVAKLPNLEERFELAKNFIEEHGGGSLEHSHKHTFITYLKALHINQEKLNAPIPNSVLLFNKSLRGICSIEPFYTGAALLGMIEHAYVDVSAMIALHIHEQKWVMPNSQTHYATHEKLDVIHAQDFFNVIVPFWGNSHMRADIMNGLILGATLFWNLYLSLLPTEYSDAMAR